MIKLKSTVHVYSVIPKLADIVAQRLPKVNIKNVSVEGANLTNGSYGKIVTKEEILKLQDAKIILADANLISQIYKDLQNAQWVQLTWAGVEKIVAEIRINGKPSYPVSRMNCSKFSQLLTEYTIGWLLICERNWMKIQENQVKSLWHHGDNGEMILYRSLQDITVAVLGLGAIGMEVVRFLKYFGCKVLGLGNDKIKPDHILLDKFYFSQELPSLLEESDYIINVLPSTPQTQNLLGGNTLKFAKKKPIFINIGRGDIIDENAIIAALNNSWLSGAVLDVFNEEPLPKSSHLWSHPKVIITPHVAGIAQQNVVVDSFEINFKRFVEGKQLLNTVDWDRGY